MEGAVGYVVGGRYRLIELVGQGGMGRVWRAADGLLGREVALKEVAPPPGLSEEGRMDYVARMRKEARSAARLSHPNVINVHDVVHEGDVPWIVMEFVAGESLASLLKRSGPLPWPQAAVIGAQVAQALAHAHERQIVHRDLKPDNVLLAGRRVVLTDFGIARVLDETVRQTSSGAVIGTPQYMSPEQIEGQVIGPAADLWSLGVLLYCVVEGNLPYNSPTMSTLFATILTQPIPPPRRAGPLTPVVTGLLAKDAGQRPRAAETAEFLTRLGSGQSGPPPRWSVAPTATPGQPQPQSWQQGQQSYGQYQARPYGVPQQQPYGGVRGSGSLASWGRRVGAALIDLLCLAPSIGAYVYATSNQTTAGAIALLTGLAYFIGVQGWQLYKQGSTGQTIGKRAFNIKVIRMSDGRYTGFGRAIVRLLAHYSDILVLYVGFIWPLWDAKNQTLADKICHTVVVNC